MTKEINDCKVCFAASSGGHLEQLLVLSPLMKEYSSFILTEETSYKSTFPVPVEYVNQVNRHERSFIQKIIQNLKLSLQIYDRHRPDVVVCTGVLATVPMCIIAKMHGAKLIYIESFAKTDSPTLTGKILYRFADVFYVQWESMLAIYPNARYVGGIY